MLILCHLSQNSQLLRSPYDQHYLAAQIVLGEPCKKHWRIKTEMTLRLAECQKAYSETSPLSLFSTAPVCSSYTGNYCIIGKFLFHRSAAWIPLLRQLQPSAKPKTSTFLCLLCKFTFFPLLEMFSSLKQYKEKNIIILNNLQTNENTQEMIEK